MLSDRRQDVKRQSVGLREVAGHEIHVTVHQRRDEADPAGQPVQLGDDENGPVSAAGSQGSGELRAVILLAALDLAKLLEQLTPLSGDVGGDCRSLGLEPKA